tara:strand:+ start:10188 stop:12320 length:2133 start_codon:yes stop_codon:yes gene_type:complete
MKKQTTTDFSTIRDLFTDFHRQKEDKKKLLEETMKAVQKIFKADGVTLWTIEEKTQFMKIEVASGLSLKYIRYFNKTDRIRFGHGIVGRVMKYRKTLTSTKASQDRRIGLARWREIIKEEGIEAVLSSPMFLGQTVVGTFNVYYKKLPDHRFTPKEIKLAEIFAHHFALFLIQDRSFRQGEEIGQKLIKYRGRVLKLRDVTGFLSLRVRKSFQKTLKLITEQILSDFGGSKIAIFQKENKNMFLVESYGFSENTRKHLNKHPLKIDTRVPINQAFVEQKIQKSSKVLIEDNVEKSWKTLLANEGVVGESVFPLTVRDDPIGVLSVYYPHEHQYLPEEIGILDTIAHFLAVSLENLRIFLSLSAEQQKNLAIINNLTDGLLLFNKENNVNSVNPKTEQIFNVKAKDLMGKPILELNKFPALKSLVSLIKERKKEIFRKELQLKESLILEVSTVPIIKEKERAGTLVILHDITREKRVEKMKTEFVSIAAHQLRTPLSITKWAIKMLLAEDLGEIPKKQKDVLSRADQSNDRMIDLINDLLNITKIEEGRYIYKPILSDLKEVTQFVVDSLKESIKTYKVEVDFQKPIKKLPKIKIDVVKVKLAIQNILDNAIRYSPEGGKVTVSLKYDKKEIEFSVKDNGIGIPKKYQPRIFTKFFRGINAVRKETEGSGLGLYIAKNIIEAHGGRIWFESQENNGATFHFALPIKRIIRK